MLVLTRKVGEGIAIGDDVKIVVMQIKGKQVRLGIKASPSTAVHREEIYQKIQDENRAAARGAEQTLVNQAQSVLGQQTGSPGQTLGQVPIRRQVKSRAEGGESDNTPGGLRKVVRRPSTGTGEGGAGDDEGEED